MIKDERGMKKTIKDITIGTPREHGTKREQKG